MQSLATRIKKLDFGFGNKLNFPSKIAFDDNAKPVGSVDFDYDAVEVERCDHEAAITYYREKLPEVIRFIFDSLLSGNPTAEVAGRRAYFLALILKQPPFTSQTQLASHLGVSKVAVNQQLNTFAQKNPLFKGLLHERDAI